MKWGDKFSPVYVNRLYAMISRNINYPFNLTCFTDNSNGIRDEVKIQPLLKLDISEDLPERGWNKINIFEEHLANITGPVLFLDLDVLIVDNIDCFFDHPGEFLIIHDKKKKKSIEGNSSVLRFNVGDHTDILEFFKNNFEHIRKKFRHEQAYISNEINKKRQLKYWPDEWVPSFKYGCLPPWHKRFIEKPSIPKMAKIIIFHGLPNPPEAILGKSGKWYRYIKPSPWIKEYWCE